MKRTADQNMVKQINKSLVLEQIRRHSPISRALIAENTGLTKATVSSLVQELIDSQLANEIGTGQSRGGRKPVMLLFNEQAGHAIGIDLGVQSITAVLTDLNGDILAEERSAHSGSTTTVVFEQLKAIVDKLMKQAPDSPYGVVGIGIGIPGFSDEDGNILFAPNLGWSDVPLRSILEKELGLPVVIENEANTGALAERQFGSGVRDVSNLIYVSLSEGIGTGIIIRDELYRGVAGFAGEFGHVSVDPDGKRCRCGNFGCWELYASENALLEHAHRQLNEHRLELEDLLVRAERGQSAVLEVFDWLGRYLGIGLVNIMNVFNPKKIIVGGRLARAEKWLTPAMTRELERRSVPHPRSHVEIVFSRNGERPTVLGAAWLAISRFLAADPSAIKK